MRHATSRSYSWIIPPNRSRLRTAPPPPAGGVCTSTSRAAEEVCRAVDWQDELGLQMALVGEQRFAALSASDAVYRAHIEVLLLYQSEDVKEAADELLVAASTRYGLARRAKKLDASQVERRSCPRGWCMSWGPPRDPGFQVIALLRAGGSPPRSVGGRR